MLGAGQDVELAATAATLMHVLAKGSNTAATMLFELGAVPCLVDFIAARGGRVLPACAALECICTASQDGATLALDHGALRALVVVLASEERPHVCAVAAAALGALSVQAEGATPQIGAECALQAAVETTLLAARPTLGDKGVKFARTGICKIIQACDDYDALVWTLENLPYPSDEAPEGGEPQVATALFKRLGAKLASPGHGQQKLDFVNRGALAKAQQARSYRPTEPKDSLKQLNSAFPPQMVAATDPEYERKLLDKIDKGAGA